MSDSTEQFWVDKISKELVGKKIKSIRYMSDEEQEDIGWYSKAVVIELDNGTIMYPSQDDEGNDAGSIFYQSKDNPNGVIPVI